MILLALTVAVFVAHCVFLCLGNEYNEWITDTFSLNSKKDMLLLALVYTMTRLLMITAAFGTIYGMLYLIGKVQEKNN